MTKQGLAIKKSFATKIYTDNAIFEGLRNKLFSEIKAKTAYFMHLIEEWGNSCCLWKHRHRLTRQDTKHKNTDVI